MHVFFLLQVIVKFDNQSVPGSPFKPKILQNKPAVEVGSPSDICMSPEGITPKDLPKLKGELESPSGKKKPVELKEGPDDSILASFVPDEPGINQLHLKKDGKEVPGSPVPVLAREKPIIGEPSKIPLEAIDCDIPNDIAKMTGILTRPNGKDEEIKVCEGPQGTIEFEFVPEEPGKHLITVSKDCKQIKDSPFVVMVEGMCMFLLFNKMLMESFQISSALFQLLLCQSNVFKQIFPVYLIGSL